MTNSMITTTVMPMLMMMVNKVLRATVREALDELSKGNAVLVHCAQGKCVSSSSESSSYVIVFIIAGIIIQVPFNNGGIMHLLLGSQDSSVRSSRDGTHFHKMPILFPDLVKTILCRHISTMMTFIVSQVKAQRAMAEPNLNFLQQLQTMEQDGVFNELDSAATSS